MRGLTDLLNTGGVESSLTESSEFQKDAEVDQEALEEQLIRFLQTSDAETRRNPPMMRAEDLCLRFMSHDLLNSRPRLSGHEVCGFVAEMQVDGNGEVRYVDHVKMAIPIVLQLRKHVLLKYYLQEPAGTTVNFFNPPTPDDAEFDEFVPFALPRTAAESEQQCEDDSRRERRRLSVASIRTDNRRSSSKSVSGEARRNSRGYSSSSGSNADFNMLRVPPGRGVFRRRLRLQELQCL